MLNGKKSAPQPGAKIEVDQAHWADRLEFTRRSLVGRPAKTPTYERYAPRGEVAKAATVVLFLVKTKDGLSLVAENAWEVGERVDEVKKLIEKYQRK